MKRFEKVASASLLLSVLSAGAAPAAPAAVVPSREAPREVVSLRAYLADVYEGIGSGRFVEGHEREVDALGRAAGLIRSGRLADAAAAVRSSGYRVEEVRDRAAGRTYGVLREAVPCRMCWGTFVIDPGQGRRKVLVEAPHPQSDLHTEQFALEAFQRLGARALLVAGTKRDAGGPVTKCAFSASDMARNDRSAFLAVHRSLLRRGGWVLQYHGFKDKAGYPDVVISDGVERKTQGAAPRPGAHLARLGGELGERGITAGTYTGGGRFKDLAATCNPVGAQTRAAGALFVHLEHKPAIRASAAARAKAVEAAVAAVDGSGG
ncbi:hypothetical protein J8N05_18675 [Streptomyces sp. BH-SS-21]|uniref:Uncharacterized protein n=1 Tax=Streptomyces liliiviolaceus TaxID=2823109 RepID=A0A940XV73_9ACTN|nr:hypothetical protein [Streptomyces liliiviolaceus]MBQ0850223.1 hypothetical protein [Streptomyces liliiviolaceus]